jgi:hypothetical protein
MNKEEIKTSIKLASSKLKDDYGVTINWTKSIDEYTINDLKGKLTYIEWMADSEECKYHQVHTDSDGNTFRSQPQYTRYDR